MKNEILVVKTSRGFAIVDMDENKILLPTKMEVCGRCHGKGVHDHPAFSNGLTQSDFDEDPDFREEYFNGRYDVTCGECGGRNVVAIPDEDRMTPEQITALHLCYQEERSYHAEIEMERRMGC